MAFLACRLRSCGNGEQYVRATLLDTQSVPVAAHLECASVVLARCWRNASVRHLASCSSILSPPTDAHYSGRRRAARSRHAFNRATDLLEPTASSQTVEQRAVQPNGCLTLAHRPTEPGSERAIQPLQWPRSGSRDRVSERRIISARAVCNRERAVSRALSKLVKEPRVTRLPWDLTSKR